MSKGVKKWRSEIVEKVIDIYNFVEPKVKTETLNLKNENDAALIPLKDISKK